MYRFRRVVRTSCFKPSRCIQFSARIELCYHDRRRIDLPGRVVDIAPMAPMRILQRTVPHGFPITDGKLATPKVLRLFFGSFVSIVEMCRATRVDKQCDLMKTGKAAVSEGAPYALKSGEGWTYRYGVPFVVKAGELHP